jgi:hypothetical protein
MGPVARVALARSGRPFWRQESRSALPFHGNVEMTRGQCLAMLAIGVRDAGELGALDGYRLRDCLGVSTVALLRPTAVGAL